MPQLSVGAVKWDYEEDECKLTLIKQAVKKAKHKADEMMAVIDYAVVGIRSCSDSYQLPTINEVILSQMGNSKEARTRTRIAFKCKRSHRYWRAVSIQERDYCDLYGRIFGQ